jgi:predicted membrane channel-forming protein YqfA (hemolysin III family)
METRPPEKRLEMAPFTVHATRGLLRDQKMRRIMMAISTALAVIMLITGLTLFRSWLHPHEHPWRFVLFWLACAWLTVLAILLALFDLLLVRAEARAARKAFREQVADAAAQISARESDQD